MGTSIFDVAWRVFLKGDMTRKDISNEFDMSLSGVSVIVGRLKDSGVVLEKPLNGTRIGRSPNILNPNPRALKMCGVDMASYDIEVSIYDFGMNVIEEKTVNLSPEKFLNESARVIWEFCDGIDYVGVSLPGIIESHTGVLLNAAVPELEGKDVKGILENMTEKHVCVVNDANAAAIAEYHRRRENSLLGIFLSRGVGMGYVRNGEIFLGANGYAGELGGVVVSKDKKLDDLIYVENLSKDVRDLSEALNTSNPFFEFVSDVLSKVISSLIYIFDPGLVVLIARKELSDDGVSSVKKKIFKNLEYPFNKETRIEKKMIDGNPAAYGAAILAARCWLSGVFKE